MSPEGKSEFPPQSGTRPNSKVLITFQLNPRMKISQSSHFFFIEIENYNEEIEDGPIAIGKET